MAGNYNEELRLKGDPELLELADSLNDLSDVFRLTHENLAQEKNRLSSVLSYMSDGVIATNRRGQITMINSTAQRLLNLDFETATQMSILDLLDGENPYTYNELLSKTPDLLALSRIDNKSTQLDVEMTNFTAFMTYILNRFDQIKSQETNTGKTYEIIRDYPVNSIWVEIDTDKMTQVVDNILNNAIKYSPDGGKITVSMKTTDSQLIVSISDQGLGIPKKDLPLIFDRFYRVDKARSRAQGGTGLGLSIAKEIIKQHKGFIWAKSEYGKGSTFTIVLPYDKDAMMVDEWEM